MEKKIYKTFNVDSKAVDADKGIYEALISTEDVDRDKDVMVADGAEIGSYLKNPVVLFGHNYRDAKAVVGKALEIVKIAGQGIKAVFQFASKEVSEDADLVRRLWAGGFLNATSIGFIPEEWEERKDEEGEKLQRGTKFNKWELLEFSIVPVPANQNALRLAMKSIGEDVPEGTIEFKYPCPQCGKSIQVSQTLFDLLITGEGLTYGEKKQLKEELIQACLYCSKGITSGTTTPADIQPQETDVDSEPNNTDDAMHDESDGLTEAEWEQTSKFLEALKEVLNHE
jgi:HK97 family phage prohead protease